MCSVYCSKSVIFSHGPHIQPDGIYRHKFEISLFRGIYFNLKLLRESRYFNQYFTIIKYGKQQVNFILKWYKRHQNIFVDMNKEDSTDICHTHLPTHTHPHTHTHTHTHTQSQVGASLLIACCFSLKYTESVHYTVAQLVAALLYKPRGRGFDTSGRTMALGSSEPLKETSTRNIFCGERGKGGRCVGLTTLPRTFADCLEILRASTSWSPKGLSRFI